MALQIVTDSSSDLSLEVAQEHNIRIVPLYVNFGNSFSRPETELSREKYWELVAEYTQKTPPVYPQTSQPSRHDFESVFRKILTAGNEVLCISITSEHSGTYENACAVKQELGKGIEVFDSQFLTWGQGFMALEAAKATKEGKSLQEILWLLEDLRSRTHVVAALDTLTFLKKGGRADKIIDVLERLTSFLDLKVIVHFIDGRIKPLGKARTMTKALEKICEHIESLGKLEKLGVVYTRKLPRETQRNAKEPAQRLAKELRTRTGFQEETMTQETGAVLTSHAGPGAYAVVAVTAA